jgi:hypothetical protein
VKVNGEPCRAFAIRGQTKCIGHIEGPVETLPRPMCRGECGQYDYPHLAGYGKCTTDQQEVLARMKEAGSFQPARPPRNPRRFDRRAKRAYVKAIAAGGRRLQTMRALGYSPGTLQRALDADPIFAKAVLWAEQEASETPEQALYRLAVGELTNGIPHFDALKMWLQARSERWHPEKIKLEVSGQVNHELEVGPALERIEVLRARLSERRELGSEGVVDVDELADDPASERSHSVRSLDT